MTSVAVVGAGLAGLAAGLELEQRGERVEVFERSRLLGGKATSFVVDGAEVDNGQHVHLACCTEFIDFVEQLGMGDKLTLQARFEVTVFRAGRVPTRLAARRLPAPLHLLVAFAGYRGLNWRAKLQVVSALVAARGSAPRGQTAAGWLASHRQGADAVSRFWEPFIVPAINAPLEMASAEALLLTIRTAFLSHAGAARVGWATVPLARIAEAAAARIGPVHRRTAVVGLLGDQRRVRGVRLDGGREVAFDAVVLAVPPRSLARLLVHPERWALSGIGDFTPAPIVDVHLWFERGGLGTAFAALLDSPVQWAFDKGGGHICCSLSAASDVMGLSEAALVSLCHRELTAAVPGLASVGLLRGAATRDREATFVPTPGLRRPGPLTAAPNLMIAGAWTDTGWLATLESAVRSGRTAARALLAEREVA